MVRQTKSVQSYVLPSVVGRTVFKIWNHALLSTGVHIEIHQPYYKVYFGLNKGLYMC